MFQIICEILWVHAVLAAMLAQCEYGVHDVARLDLLICVLMQFEAPLAKDSKLSKITLKYKCGHVRLLRRKARFPLLNQVHLKWKRQADKVK